MEVSFWKCIKCFPSTLDRRNLNTQQSPVSLDLSHRVKLGQEDHVIIVTSSFEKAPFSKCFLSTRKWRKAGVFKFLRFEERLVWTVGLTVEIKLCFQLPPAWWGPGMNRPNDSRSGVCKSSNYRKTYIAQVTLKFNLFFNQVPFQLHR